MTLPQQNTASARPTSFYYLMCQLDRVQYRLDNAAMESFFHIMKVEVMDENFETKTALIEAMNEWIGYVRIIGVNSK